MQVVVRIHKLGRGSNPMKLPKMDTKRGLNFIQHREAAAHHTLSPGVLVYKGEHKYGETLALEPSQAVFVSSMA